MASTTGASNSICPYYIREYKRSITCEGLIDGEETLHRFRSVKEKCAHQRRCCFRYDYDRCPYAKALDDIYDE